MKELDRIALFRLSVLGPLVSRPSLERGELQTVLRDLAQKENAIPGSRRRHVAEKTLQGWYYRYLRDGLDGLAPKLRSDRGRSKLESAIQEALLTAKRENPRRSLAKLQQWLEHSGQIERGGVSRSAIHRLLQQHGISRPPTGASVPEERRRFTAAHANDIWYGDVLHGPQVRLRGRGRKAYLVSLLDDASRLIPHSAFCLGETALDIEGVLKQAVLKRGVARKLVVDNGAAYRASTLQTICARGSARRDSLGTLPRGSRAYPTLGHPCRPTRCHFSPSPPARCAQGRHRLLPGQCVRGPLRAQRKTGLARRRSAHRCGRRRRG